MKSVNDKSNKDKKEDSKGKPSLLSRLLKRKSKDSQQRDKQETKEDSDMLDIALVDLSKEDPYFIAEQALERLDVLIEQNRVMKREVKQLLAFAQSINRMLG